MLPPLAGEVRRTLQRMRSAEGQEPKVGEYAHDVRAVHLRAATDADRHFSFTVAREALGPYARALGIWDDARARDIEDERFGRGNFEIIEFDGVPVGCLRCELYEDHLRLVRLALLQEWQGRGIGSAVLRAVIHRAAAHSGSGSVESDDQQPGSPPLRTLRLHRLCDQRDARLYGGIRSDLSPRGEVAIVADPHAETSSGSRIASG